MDEHAYPWADAVHDGLLACLRNVVQTHCPSTAGCACLELRTAETDPLLDVWLEQRRRRG